ncbi:hypothetical protein DOTSEDRAFT_44281 [Dothistroma septosporum NZE10]|uniref:Uncharacterized protein n=1 Tax=Dothistroma septosporum (strain NZE10 / CBS 128990) TaxID=675120 RepID=N1PKV4_DOTSN|nr:hypothetical protein DOTSEDRAFT_44281 [Dothistroma septosporum NZE10]
MSSCWTGLDAYGCLLVYSLLKARRVACRHLSFQTILPRHLPSTTTPFGPHSVDAPSGDTEHPSTSTSSSVPTPSGHMTIPTRDGQATRHSCCASQAELFS